jgi:hypothetical protein
MGRLTADLLLELEDVPVELLLQHLVRKVDAQLLEAARKHAQHKSATAPRNKELQFTWFSAIR